jgi:hypothetical protein
VVSGVGRLLHLDGACAFLLGIVHLFLFAAFFPMLTSGFVSSYTKRAKEMFTTSQNNWCMRILSEV